MKTTALTLDMARGLPKGSGKKRLVFAPTKYLDSIHLDEHRIEFCQLPFEIYKAVKRTHEAEGISGAHAEGSEALPRTACHLARKSVGTDGEWLFDFAEKAWEKAGVGRIYLKKKDGLGRPLPVVLPENSHRRRQDAARGENH